MVNIKDVKDLEEGATERAQRMLEEARGCRLIAMFNRQRELEERYHGIEEKNLGRKLPPHAGYLEDIDDPQVQYRLKELFYRVVEELCEASNTLKNGKPWKSTHVKTDVDHFIEEMADAMHFFLELCAAAGINEHLLYRVYMDKSSVNQFRQESNY